MKRIKRWCFALLLLPVCYGLSRAMGSVLRPFQDVPEGSFYFGMGVLSYFGFQWVLSRPMRTYVFGHELTHALAAWMSGANVKNFKVSKNGGSVSVSKTNLWVALAPYMVPIYAVGLLLLYYGVNCFYPLSPYWRWMLWCVGVAIGFHIGLTTHALMQGQPDLKMGGRFLSGVLIYLGNVIVLVSLLAFLFPRTVSWRHFLRRGGSETWGAVEKIALGGYALWNESRQSPHHAAD